MILSDLQRFQKSYLFKEKLASPKIATFVTFTSDGDDWEFSPKEFRIEGSNDGNSFITLSAQSTSFDGWNQKRTFRFKNTQPFSYYRIVITENHDFGVDPIRRR